MNVTLELQLMSLARQELLLLGSHRGGPGYPRSFEQQEQHKTVREGSVGATTPLPVRPRWRVATRAHALGPVTDQPVHVHAGRPWLPSLSPCHMPPLLLQVRQNEELAWRRRVLCWATHSCTTLLAWSRWLPSLNPKAVRSCRTCDCGCDCRRDGMS